MYSREIKIHPERLVQNGKANFGTFSGVSKKVDIRGMRAPYAGLPLPSFISNLRIKSNLNFIFSLDKYIGLTTFSDFKVFGLAEIIFWDKSTGKRYAYHTIMPTRRRFVPTTTNRGICASYRKARYIKNSWGREHQHHSLSFKVKGDSVRPDAQGYCYSPMQDFMHTDMTFVNPSPASSRCTATWLSTMTLNGHILVENQSPVDISDSTGLGAMVLNRAYYKFRSKKTIAFGIGTIKDKNIIFHIKSSNMDAADSNNFNSNELVVNGETTVLPPVYITHPFGINGKWIIQDTESMIDLSFNPISVNTRTLNIVALRTRYSTIYGTYEGVLLTQSGEKIILKNFPGVVYTDTLRL